MHEGLIRKTLLFTAIFFGLSMSSILYVSAHKAIVISDFTKDEGAASGGREETEEDWQKLRINQEGLLKNELIVPLPAGIKVDSISMENNYMEMELLIMFEGEQEEFYLEKEIACDPRKVEAGLIGSERKRTTLKFSLTGIYEYRSILEDGFLKIEFMLPRDLYQKIVVIDPAGGAKDFGNAGNNLAEKNLTLQVAKKLKERLEATGVKAYFTRFGDENPSAEARVRLANMLGADSMIRIQVAADTDPDIFGTQVYYNDRYFIPGFGNSKLADLLLRSVVTEIEGKANGLIPAAEEDLVLKKVKVPAAAISIGYLTNEEEADLLGQENYLDRVAAGIYNAIMIE